MIDVTDLTLTYRSSAQHHLAVDHVCLRIESGQFYTLLGPSGCGKTTTLRCIAGLERADAGEILIDGAAVFSSRSGAWVPPHQRRIGMVFQSYAIWPHMSVFDNVAFPLRYGVGRPAAHTVRDRVMEALAMVQLAPLAERAAPHLSGGQQQRLALARALVMKPRVLLLDEPLSNLDAKLREEMRGELRRLVKATGVTTVFVTHEQIEALTLSDVVAVMKDGRIVQQGTPLEIYQRPETPFVADFIGRSNLFPGKVTEAGNGTDVIRVDSPIGAINCWDSYGFGSGATVMVAIRPEHLELSPGEGSENRLVGVLDSQSFVGNGVDCIVRVGEQPVKITIRADRVPALGSKVALYVAPRYCLPMPASA